MANRVMKYYALKRLKVGTGYREAGDEVPEAASWRNIQSYINRSMIQAIPVEPDEVQGGVDLRSQAGRSESPRPKHKPLVPSETSQNEISAKADLDKLKAAQIVKGLEEGSLEPTAVERYELDRAEKQETEPRKTVLRAVGWSDAEIAAGKRVTPEIEPVEPDLSAPYEDWSDAQLHTEWHKRFDGQEPDTREGIIDDLKVDDEAEEEEEAESEEEEA